VLRLRDSHRTLWLDMKRSQCVSPLQVAFAVFEDGDSWTEYTGSNTSDDLKTLSALQVLLISPFVVIVGLHGAGRQVMLFGFNPAST
jgi:hypothetical protein